LMKKHHVSMVGKFVAVSKPRRWRFTGEATPRETPEPDANTVLDRHAMYTGGEEEMDVHAAAVKVCFGNLSNMANQSALLGRFPAGTDETRRNELLVTSHGPEIG